MNRHRVIPQSSKTIYTLPFPGESVSYVSVGEDVQLGQQLYEMRRKKIIDSYYLPEILGIKPENADDYVGRISGEYVEEGDLLAEKITAAGLIGKRVVSGHDGVIGLGRIKSGYLDILGEEEVVSIMSGVAGKVVGITLNSHMDIESSSGMLEYTYSANLTKSRNTRKGYIAGEFEMIEDGSSVYTEKSLKDTYEGKIVYCGRFLYQKLAQEIVGRGASCLITHSIDYDEIINSDLPTVVLGGFGQLPLHRGMLSLLQECTGKMIKVSVTTPAIYISNMPGPDLKRFKGNMFFTPNINVGDTVISMAPDTFGMVGEVMETFRESEIEKLMVDIPGKSGIILNIDSVESLTVHIP